MTDDGALASSERRQWEDAWIQTHRDAATGRMFRGILHNLNGVVQAFSMQAELLGMTFANASSLLDELVPSLPADLQGGARQLQDMLQKRQALMPQMLEKVQMAKDIASLAHPLRENVMPGGSGGGYAEFVRQEVELLTADSFFKHGVEKVIELADTSCRVALADDHFRFIVDVLLQNAIDALAGVQRPQIAVRGRVTGGMLCCTFEDNGDGISEEKKERLFQPFFTTRESRPGLGLYLASRVVAEAGGCLVCGASRERTVFTLTLPCLPEGGDHS
ncbi:MAG: ATP-binding protein [Thermodesulfobacteriota bacterium]